MGQHIKLEPVKEPVIFNEVKNIGQTIKKVLGVDYFLPFQKTSIVGKKIMRLSDDYKLHEEDENVFSIGEFTLQEDWQEDKWLTENTSLECHFDKHGNVNAIYIVL